jgi:serpin B
MKTTSLFLLIAITIAFSGCNKDNPEPNLTPKQLEITAKTLEVIDNSNEFGIELFTKTSEDVTKNFMLSPLSASTCLTMLLNGCGGNTYNQLKATLKYPEGMTLSEVNESYKGLVKELLAADSKVAIALANAIFYRQDFSFKAPFLATMNTEFGAKVQGLDFASPTALTTINKWASDNTNGKIEKVLSEISPDAVMFLMNALYFKGNWSYQFDKSKTSARPFYLDNGQSVNVSTMLGEVGIKFTYGNGFTAIELPYGRTNYTMVVLVPTETLAQFYSTFTYNDWSEITSSFDAITSYTKANVYMPKFKFSFEKILNDQLIAMGMVDAFSPSNANLSGISDAQLFVGFVKQNTFVEVNEEGTEAAAVTTIGVYVTSGPGPQEIKIDKPFVFAIRERTTNTLMFIGQVKNPLESN